MIKIYKHIDHIKILSEKFSWLNFNKNSFLITKMSCAPLRFLSRSACEKIGVKFWPAVI